MDTLSKHAPGPIARAVESIAQRFSGLRPTPASCDALDAQLTTAADLAGDPSLGPGSFCMPVRKLEALLREGEMDILRTAKCASGVAGAQIVYLHFADGDLVLKAKWKEAKHGGSGLNNEPRKEVAAYHIQRWFLDEDEYVVPPTVCRGIALERYGHAVHETKPTFDETKCAFGVLAFWLDNVAELAPFDEARFESDVAYRDTIANMNLLTYLIDHRDTRPANFIFSKDPARPRALSIDNGLAFSGLINPRILFKHEWRQLVVPKLPRAKIERLRHIGRAELDQLRVVAQLSVRDEQLFSTEATAAIEGDAGIRRAGAIIQLGLEPGEIDGVEKRIGSLLTDVDEGKVELY